MEAGLLCDQIYTLLAQWDRQGGRQAALQNCLTRPDRPTAIFTVKRSAGAGVLEAARSLNIMVPE